MKKIFPLFTLAVAASALLLSSCKKDHDPHGYPCQQIARLKYYPGAFGTGDEAVFIYNNKGNPVSITRSTATTGATNSIFRYDGQQRLTDYAGVYQDGTVFETWSHYYYDARNRIAGDTVYQFGLVGDNGPLPHPGGPPPYDTLYIGHTDIYQYDNENRVIKVVRTYNGGSTATLKFQYNGAGNLARVVTSHSLSPGETETVFGPYDNQVNLHRTHPVWQFIDLDFSRNNPFTAQTYNGKGLPVKVVVPSSKMEEAFLGIRYSTLEVEYKK